MIVTWRKCGTAKEVGRCTRYRFGSGNARQVQTYSQHNEHRVRHWSSRRRPHRQSNNPHQQLSPDTAHDTELVEVCSQVVVVTVVRKTASHKVAADINYNNGFLQKRL